MRLQVGFFTVSIVKRRIKKICLGEISKKGKSILQWARKKNVQRRRKCIQLWVSINYLNKIAKGNEKYEPKKKICCSAANTCTKLYEINCIEYYCSCCRPSCLKRRKMLYCFIRIYVQMPRTRVARRFIKTHLPVLVVLTRFQRISIVLIHRTIKN